MHMCVCTYAKARRSDFDPYIPSSPWAIILPLNWDSSFFRPSRVARDLRSCFSCKRRRRRRYVQDRLWGGNEYIVRLKILAGVVEICLFFSLRICRVGNNFCRADFVRIILEIMGSILDYFIRVIVFFRRQLRNQVMCVRLNRRSHWLYKKRAGKRFMYRMSIGRYQSNSYC